MRGEAVEARRPKSLVTFKPFIGLLHGRGIESARHNAPGFMTFHQTGARQHREMLHRRRQRHSERRGQFADRQRLLGAQAGEHAAPGPVGQRRENAIEPRL
jgi:hypothetical protein